MQMRWEVTDGHLVLTIPASEISFCKDCPDIHVLVLDRGDRENIKKLGAGLIHLAKHALPLSRDGGTLQ